MKTNQQQTIGTADQIQVATRAVQALRDKMPFLSPLSATERAQIHPIGPKTLQVTQRRLAAARNHGGSLPASFDLSRFEQDTAAATELNECLKALDQLRSDVHDTLLALGGRASRAASEAYGYIRVASGEATHLKRTLEEMAKHTPRRSRPTAPTPPAAPAAPAVATAPAAPAPAPAAPGPAPGPTPDKTAVTPEVKAA